MKRNMGLQEREVHKLNVFRNKFKWANLVWAEYCYKMVDVTYRLCSNSSSIHLWYIQSSSTRGSIADPQHDGTSTMFYCRYCSLNFITFDQIDALHSRCAPFGSPLPIDIFPERLRVDLWNNLHTSLYVYGAGWNHHSCLRQISLKLMTRFHKPISLRISLATHESRSPRLHYRPMKQVIKCLR